MIARKGRLGRVFEDSKNIEPERMLPKDSESSLSLNNLFRTRLGLQKDDKTMPESPVTNIDETLQVDSDGEDLSSTNSILDFNKL